MSKRAPLVALVLSAAAGCGAPQLAEPPEVTAPPTTATETTLPPVCTDEEAALNATRSYAPEGPLPPPGEMPAGSTMQEIVDDGRLVVGVSAGTLQFGYLNPITGVLDGFDIAVLEEVARAIFGDVDPLPIEYRVMNFAERLPALENNDVDLVAHTMTINCNRWLRIGFSSTYYDAGQKVLVPKGSGITGVQDLVANGARVCVTEGGTAFDEMSKPEYEGVQLVPETETTDCLVAMQQGRADAAVSDDTLLVGLAAQDPNLEVIGEALTEEPYGIGVNQDNVDLVQFVNGVLEEMRQDGRWEALYQEWIGEPNVAPPPPPDAVYGREQ